MANLKNTCTLAAIFIIAMSALVSANEMNDENQIMISGSMENATRIFPTVVKTLYAGQHIEVGTVTVSSDVDNLTIKYETTDNWTLKNTHLHIATSYENIPKTDSYNPIPGQFDYQGENLPCGTTNVTYVIPISNENITLFIAAHADVSKINDKEADKKDRDKEDNKDKEEKSDEGAWAEGIEFPGNNWATYFTYDIAEFIEEEKEEDNPVDEEEDESGSEGEDESEDEGENESGSEGEDESEGEEEDQSGIDEEDGSEDEEGDNSAGNPEEENKADNTKKSGGSSGSGRMVSITPSASSENDNAYMNFDVQEEQPPMVSMPEPVYEDEDQGTLAAIMEKGGNFLWIIIALLLSGIWIMSGYGLTFH
ncbi:hypothetical protein [Methanolobus chelungpuianus]|uniref:Uncharacterized protein n=1 Tax=Methanolobus chelungpuianus TaxID=502115 RepID=A0AAE3HAW2_9EURY|nr:hypothetical protein [Methanolobus chelungpuianus]MCQ6962986.1 hypothetical protein [Methanolobus chelungpuianus]